MKPHVHGAPHVTFEAGLLAGSGAGSEAIAAVHQALCRACPTSCRLCPSAGTAAASAAPPFVLAPRPPRRLHHRASSQAEPGGGAVGGGEPEAPCDFERVDASEMSPAEFQRRYHLHVLIIIMIGTTLD